MLLPIFTHLRGALTSLEGLYAEILCVFYMHLILSTPPQILFGKGLRLYCWKFHEQLWFLVALYRAMWLRFGYGFESCDANGPRNVKNTNLAKHRPVFLPHFSLLVVRNRSWEFLNEGNFTLRFVWRFDAAIRVPKEHRERDGIAEKLLRRGIASEALRRNMPLSSGWSMTRSLPEKMNRSKLYWAGGAGAWNRYDLANWRSRRWTERCFKKKKCRFSVISRYVFRGRPDNWHTGLETVHIFALRSAVRMRICQIAPVSRV